MQLIDPALTTAMIERLAVAESRPTAIADISAAPGTVSPPTLCLPEVLGVLGASAQHGWKE